MTARALLRRDLRLSLLRGADGAAALSFFLIAISVFAIAASGDLARLQSFAPQILCVSAIFSGLLGLEAIYHRDDADGTFDLLLLEGRSSLGIFGAKIAAHWLVTGLPVVLAAAPAGFMLGLRPATAVLVVAALLLQTVYASLLGGLCALLTCGSRRPALLILVIVAPLLLPSVILAVAALDAALAQTSPSAYLLLHLALNVAALPLVLAAGAGLLKATRT